MLDPNIIWSYTVVLNLTGKQVSVTPFCKEEYELIAEIPISTVATAYDCPFTGKVLVLIINKVLSFGWKKANTLLWQNQLWLHGIVIEDCPRQFDQCFIAHYLCAFTQSKIPNVIGWDCTRIVYKTTKECRVRGFLVAHWNDIRGCMGSLCKWLCIGRRKSTKGWYQEDITKYILHML